MAFLDALTRHKQLFERLPALQVTITNALCKSR